MFNGECTPQVAKYCPASAPKVGSPRNPPPPTHGGIRAEHSGRAEQMVTPDPRPQKQA